jgi:hypothetical protein
MLVDLVDAVFLLFEVLLFVASLSLVFWINKRFITKGKALEIGSKILLIVVAVMIFIFLNIGSFMLLLSSGFPPQD